MKSLYIPRLWPYLYSSLINSFWLSLFNHAYFKGYIFISRNKKKAAREMGKGCVVSRSDQTCCQWLYSSHIHNPRIRHVLIYSYTKRALLSCSFDCLFLFFCFLVDKNKQFASRIIHRYSPVSSPPRLLPLRPVSWISFVHRHKHVSIRVQICSPSAFYVSLNMMAFSEPTLTLLYSSSLYYSVFCRSKNAEIGSRNKEQRKEYT